MAIVHFVNRPRSQTKAGMLFVLRYCISDKKTVDADGEKYVSGINCVPQSAYAEFISTKKIFGKNDGRQYYHFVQSFPVGENITPKVAHEIACRFATEPEIFKGYEITVATHCDRDHIHSHFVMNSVSMESGRKFHISTADIEKLMQISDDIIREYGLSVLEPRTKDKCVKAIGNNEMHTLQSGQSWKLELAITIDQCMKLAKSKNISFGWWSKGANRNVDNKTSCHIQNDRLHRALCGIETSGDQSIQARNNKCPCVLRHIFYGCVNDIALRSEQHTDRTGKNNGKHHTQ